MIRYMESNSNDKFKMPKKNILLGSLKESLTKIWQNKFLFVLLFIFQIIFFVIFSAISLNYQTKILERAKAISDYVSQQQLDEASASSNILQKKGVFGDDPLSIGRNLNDIKRNFRIYLIFTFILLVIFMSLSWAITACIASKKTYEKKISSGMRVGKSLIHKPLAKIFFKNIAILLIYLGMIFSFFFSLLNISVIDAAAEGAKIFMKYVPFLIFSMALAYFMFISISLSQNTPLKNIMQKTLSIGVRKCHYVLAAYAINISLFMMSSFLLYSSIEANFFVLILSLMLLVFSFVFGRMFLVGVVEKLG